MTEDAVRIIPLGGLGEIGKNMTAVEYRGKIVVLDCGVEFPSEEMLGIDLVLPDIRWLMERQDDVLAFVITHGHEDHHGALPFVLKQLNRPVYGSRFTLALIKSKLDEHGLLKSVDLNEVDDKSRLQLGPFDISFVADQPQRARFARHRRGHRPRRHRPHRRLPVRPHTDRRAHHRRQRVRAARGEAAYSPFSATPPTPRRRARPPRRARSARPSTRSSPRPRAA